jgi:hypothetical protein
MVPLLDPSLHISLAAAMSAPHAHNILEIWLVCGDFFAVSE